MKLHFLLFTGTLALLLTVPTSCYRVPDQIEPKVDCYVQDHYLLSLPSPFPPLTREEREEGFGKEYQIAMGFAHEMDLYQAITAFKRASFLVPKENQARKLEIEYEILLCYYMGRKYSDAIYTYEHSGLRFVNTSFPACEDMLIILFDCYTKEGNTANSERFLQYIKTYYPETAKKIEVSECLQKADLSALESYSKEPDYAFIGPFLDSYNKSKKSIGKAQALNAVIPGAGFLYIGQKQTAVTAFLVNGLFIGASYYFFRTGNVAAGAIFTTFEAGWYFGGIYGVGQETKFYNERMYEMHATSMMNQKKMFPVFMIRHAF